MLIGIDASRANKKEKTGVEWYSYYLIQSLKKIDKENRYFLYTNEKLEGDLGVCPDNFQEVILKWPLKYLWTQIRLSYEMKWGKHKPDLLFVPAHTLPILHPKKSVVTIHDVGFARYPKMYSFKNRLYHFWSTHFIAKHAAKIITVSKFSKKEIVKFFGVQPDKITVIHNGFDAEFYQLVNDQNKIVQTLQKYQIQQPYFLNIARIENKKNILGLIKGFIIFQERYDKEKNYRLILVGKRGKDYERRGRGYREIIQKINGNSNQEKIKIFGWIGREELPILMSSARAFVFPSFYEGFGIPVLEAMACGAPVITSDIPSLKEVGGEAVIYVNPNNPQEIAEKMREIISNPELVKNLRQKGFEQIKKFSWEKCARETLEVLESAL